VYSRKKGEIKTVFIKGWISWPTWSSATGRGQISGKLGIREGAAHKRDKRDARCVATKGRKVSGKNKKAS